MPKRRTNPRPTINGPLPSHHSPNPSGDEMGGGDYPPDGPAQNTRSSSKRRKISEKNDSESQNQKNGRPQNQMAVGDVKVGWLNFDEFHIMYPLGRGRSGTVFKACWRGEEVALKLCDIAQQPECKKELKKEVSVYNSLKDLQGHYIPRLKTAGIEMGLIFGIATEIVGSPIKVDQLNYIERQKIVEALSEIHRHGILHNDIRRRNILIQRGDNGFRVSFIDFAFSRKEPNESLHLNEMAQLKDLLGLEDEDT